MLRRWTKALGVFLILCGGAWLLADRLLRIAPGTRSESGGTSKGFFSPDYFAARTRFRAKVMDRGGRLSSLAIDARGPAGEDLTIDIGWFGSPQPRRVLLHTSGVHGVEGFAGSAIQLQLLEQVPAVPADSALLLVHVVNPHGMAWRRRVNENNVDLNRNFMAAPSDYSGAPPLYSALNPFLNPVDSGGPDFFVPNAAWLIARYGQPKIRQTVAEGQYEFPQGLYFGGKKLEQGPEKLQTWLAEHLGAAERVVAVDVHTGLGEFGEDSLLVDDANYARLRPVLGERVKPFDPGQGPAYRVRGSFLAMLPRILRSGAPMSVGQEFGTYSPVRVLRAMRDENRAWQSAAHASRDPEGRALTEAFCPNDEAWRRRVLARGAQLMNQARDLAF